MTYREIAEELSIPPTTVTTDLWMLRKQGYEVKPGNTRRPKTVKPPAHKMEALMEVAETRRQYALRRRKEGALLTEIADELGVHHISVSRYLRTLRERESQTAEPRS